MKALSVKQPWASMIRNGPKTIETRTWKTDYRGPLLIVSSKKPNFEPAGYALVVVNLVDCRPMIKGPDEKAACCDYYFGAWSWILEDAKPIPPFPVRDKLGLYEVDFELTEEPTDGAR